MTTQQQGTAAVMQTMMASDGVAMNSVPAQTVLAQVATEGVQDTGMYAAPTFAPFGLPWYFWAAGIVGITLLAA